METEMENLGPLLDNSTGKIGTLNSTKKGKTYRAFRHTNGQKIWFGSTLQDKTDAEIKLLLPTIEVGKIDNNYVAFIDAWTWE
jgi:hypothetical protein